MTNYIDAVLREQEEQESRREERDWRKAWEEAVLPASDGREAAGTGSPAGEMAERGAGENRTVAGRAEETEAAAAARLLAEGISGEALSMWEETGMSGRNGGGAEWIYQALRQSLTESPVPRRENGVIALYKPQGTGTAGGWDADGLDRLVRRDARRFDGGFQLL